MHVNRCKASEVKRFNRQKLQGRYIYKKKIRIYEQKKKRKRGVEIKRKREHGDYKNYVERRLGR